MNKTFPADVSKFINPHQLGGILEYTINNGEARGVRVCEVNTGGGLRYRVLLDRGMDIDHAFMQQHSVAFLTHKNLTAPSRAFDRGMDWLKSFPGGLLTSCGPFNTGGPADDAGETLGLHGPHSNTAAEIESVIQPDPHAGRNDMSIIGTMRYGGFYGPNLTLRRTIRSTLGVPTIRVEDAFTNRGNDTIPHAWLLHINFGYPLLDEGTKFLIDYSEQSPRGEAASQDYFRDHDGKTFPAPSDDQRGDGQVFRYLTPVPKSDGRSKVGIWNEKLSLGVAIDYSTKEFPRLGQWMHWGKHEYVSALEPMTGGVEGRDVDRRRGWLRTLAAGESTSYTYELSVFDNVEKF